MPDEEVTSLKADAFGVHTAYAKLLQRVASDCPTPFAIGLYSTWGSGKTSIIRLLQEIVAANGQSALTIVYLDVWKYSSDPLKRWILLETERQLTKLRLLNGYKFQGRTMQSHLEFEESLEDKDRIEIDFKNFSRLTGVIVLGIVLCGLAWIYLPATGRFFEIFRWLVALSAGGGVVALIVSAALKKIGESLSGLIFRRTVRHVTAKPAFSSEKFNEIFRDVVSQATNGKERRLVFVFDNLDRCPAEVAVDVIGVVKTFLDEPGCVYVIPCDEQAILTHIKATFLKPPDSEASDSYANQFLTKFFQMTLRLPPAADFAVEDYLDRQLKEAGMEDLNTDARDVLILGYRGETPRQIKRVLNDLIAYRGIAEQIEAEKLVEVGALTSDLGHLTKMAVLSVKWPSFMRRLADDPLLWTDVMQRVRSQADVGMENVAPDLQQFLWNTRFVSPEVDIRPWLYLRRGTLEKDASLNRRVEEILQNGAWKALLELLGDEAMKDKKQEILQIVSSIVRRWQNSDRRVLLRNGGPVLLKASLAVPDDVELRKDALDVLDHLASNASPEELEQLFDVKDICRLLETR
ncbi:MAG TPA: P-loop NTPase fold protein [Verrucomicrobiae bacterium]|nr:P-loop NTPase fold protein [Verrucomicrobiae bacterium]